ncbi:hypothetical protein COHA_002449 [Chlorella ohadii]|uniref:Wax synthase domain-containing protein n=1 Tax=Chlorella ohadii TaxID=2649997 RepID=A0AAD5H8N6_9CHLO|nr:hypothetical protein COHA_002449 [Chlorella ohadii]
MARESLSLSFLPFPARLLLLLAWLLAGGLARGLARRRPAGWARAVAALPLVALNQLAAAGFFDGDAELINNCAHFSTACITNMKLLAWAMGRGSLTHPLTFAQWLAVYALPIIPADEQAGPPDAGGKQQEDEQEEPEDSQAKRKGARRPGPTAQARSGFSQYLGLSLGADAMAAAVTSTTGLAIAPPFNNPYASTSLADFWNRRWNMTVSAVLRAAVYDVIMDGRFVRRAGVAAPFSRARRLVAVLAVFFCSGVMHELLFWNFSGHFSPRLVWLVYFTLWGVLVVTENVAKRMLRRAGLSVPTPLSRLLTLVTIQVMGGYLWWPPMEQLGLPEKATAHTLQTWRALQKTLLGARTN